ncbi:MAG: hypothetical protein HY318_07035 [Armatimonadetes bacterium]|nr:hypothetical protein [Armatimonadota bacterium]
MQLFLISFLILFLELACIRFLPAYVRLLGYFANTVLLASFLGMSVGCLTARRKSTFLHAAPLLIFLMVSLTAIVWGLSNYKRADVSISPELSKALIYFGADQTASTPVHLPLEAVLSVAFLLVALIFVGLGQIMGREFDRYPPITAYMINITGSLVGVAAFTGTSSLSLTPVWWFGVSFLLMCWWLRGVRWRSTANLILLMLSIMTIYLLDHVTQSPSGDAGTHWSPYYKIRYALSSKDGEQMSIAVNEIGHQCANDVSGKPTVYSVPYAMLLQSGFHPDRTLVIGAGSGNDVAAALRHGAKSVDAVEIDPFIMQLGKLYHPNQPYQDTRVHLTNDDGRSFVRNTHQQYDLIVYGLVDSLTLMSTYSSVRLETYLFTLQAFRDIKAHLDEDGVFVIYNYFRESWLALRIANMLEEVYGEEPLVFTFPPVKEVSLTKKTPTKMFSIFVVGKIGALRQRYQKGQVFLLKSGTSGSTTSVGAFVSHLPGEIPEGVKAISPVALAAPESTVLPADDWPFLYLRERGLPSYLLRGMALVILISLLVLFTFGKGELKGRFNPHFFFLGAAFMLLETKSVTSLALLFGSTWRVNAVVFFSILVMILLANLYVLKRPSERFALLYTLLIAALLANYALPAQSFLGLAGIARLILSPVVIFLPILLAALVFANSFRVSQQPSADIGWNIAGVMIGGLCENLSLLMGCQNLLLVAAAFYLLSALTRKPGFRHELGPAGLEVPA